MAVRWLVGAAVCLLLMVACNDDSDSTSGFPGTDEWVVAEIDARPGTGQWPRVVVGPNGEIGVAYIHQRRQDRSELKWIYCETAKCDTMLHTTLGAGSLTLAWRDAASWNDDALVILGDEPDEGGRSSGLLWSCAEATCEAASEIVVGNSPIGITGGTEHAPVIAYSKWNESKSNYEIFAAICEDASCATRAPVQIYTTMTAGYGSPEIKSLPDGSPVLFFQEGVAQGGGAWTVVVCADPACSRAENHHDDGSRGTNQALPESGLPFILYTKGPEIHQLFCADRTCSGVSDRTVYTVADGAEVGHVYGTRLDGDLFVLYQTSTGEVRSYYQIWDLSLLRCDAEACEQIADVPFGEGFAASMARKGEATLAIAVQSGRPEPCFENCADDPRDLSRLTLYLKDFTNE